MQTQVFKTPPPSATVVLEDIRVPEIIPAPPLSSLSVEGIKLQPVNVGGMKMTLTEAGKPQRNDQFHTFSSTPSNPITVKALKTMMRKYIRLGDINRSAIAAIEMWRMHEIGDVESPKDMILALALAAIEDISVAAPALVTTVVDYCSEWHAEIVRQKTSIGNYVDIYQVIFLLKSLAESLKTKVVDHIWYTYPEGKSVAFNYDIKVVSEEHYREAYLSIIKGNEDILNTYFKPEDPEAIWMLGVLFYHYLRSKDGNAIVWLGYYIRLSYGKDALKTHPRTGGRTNPLYIIFSMLGDLLGKDLKHYQYLYKTETNQAGISYVKYLTVNYLLGLGVGNTMPIPAAEARQMPVSYYLRAEYHFDLTTNSDDTLSHDAGSMYPYDKIFDL
jgi:hypothetical protein